MELLMTNQLKATDIAQLVKDINVNIDEDWLKCKVVEIERFSDLSTLFRKRIDDYRLIWDYINSKLHTR